VDQVELYPPQEVMELYPHQHTTIDLLGQYNEFAVILDQGCGKSAPILKDWINRLEAGTVDDLVVIGPKGAYLNWTGTSEEPGELDKWVPKEWLSKIYIASWRQDYALFRQALNNLLYAKGPRFLNMNVEALNRPGKARDYLMTFTEGRRVIGVIDESTTCARIEAARTRWILFDLAPRFTCRRILSGLVAPESPIDLFTQYHFLDWRIIGRSNIYAFKNRYAITHKIDFRPKHMREQRPDKKPAEVILGFRNLDELNTKIMMRSYRVTKDVLKLPPKIYQFWDVDLEPEQQRIYNEMRDIATAKLLNNEWATASMKLDQLGKMQHILCGHVRNEVGEVSDIPENRTAAVLEILEKHSGKAIVWCPYPQSLRKIRDALQERFGDDSTVGFWGETKLEDRLIARARIQNDDACRFIVSNQSVGKFGNTWTRCDLVIYFANSFDNEDRQQSEDRAHRIGQTKSVTYIDLRARGTLDEKLIKVLRKKMSISSSLQGDEFKEWLI
jgi:hypothetical protein